MSLFGRALLRDLRASWLSVLAVTGLVAISVAIAGGAYAGLDELEDATRALYDELAFYDAQVLVQPTASNGAPSAESIVQQTPGLRAASWRLVLPARARLEDEQTPVAALLVALAADTPPSVCKSRLLAGAPISSSQSNGVVIDQTFASDHGVQVGDPLWLNLAGNEIEVRVRGVAIFPEFLVPALGDTMPEPIRGAAVYIQTPDSLLENLLGFTPVNALALQLDDDGALGDVQRRLADLGLQVRGVVSRDDQPSASWHQRRLDAFRDFLPTLVGLFNGIVLIVVPLLVWRSVEGYRKQIGTLLCLGFGRSALLRSWLMLVSAELVLGGALGLLGGLAVARIVVQSYQKGPGFPLEPAALGLGPMLAAWAVSAVVVMTCTAGPILYILNRPPSQLLVERMGDDRPSPLMRAMRWLDHRIQAVFMPLASTRLAVRNVLRRPLLTFLSVTCAAAVMVLSSAMNVFNSSILELLTSYFDQQRWTTMLELESPLPSSEVEALLAPLGVRSWEGSRGLTGWVELEGVQRSYVLVGADRPSELRGSPLVEGRWLSGPDSGEIILDQRAARRAGLHSGDTIRAGVGSFDAELTLVGLSNNLDLNQAIVPEATLGRMGSTPGTFARVFVDAVDPELLSAQLYEDRRVVFVASKERLQQAVLGMTALFVDLMALASVLASFVGSLVVIELSMVGTRERRVDFAMLSALAWSKAQIARTILIETIAVVLLAVLVAIPVTWLACWLFQRRMANLVFWVPVPFAPSQWLIYYAPPAVFMLGVIVPALRFALRSTIADLLRAR